jgi:hypothetical protein
MFQTALTLVLVFTLFYTILLTIVSLAENNFMKKIGSQFNLQSTCLPTIFHSVAAVGYWNWRYTAFPWRLCVYLNSCFLLRSTQLNSTKFYCVSIKIVTTTMKTVCFSAVNQESAWYCITYHTVQSSIMSTFSSFICYLPDVNWKMMCFCN